MTIDVTFLSVREWCILATASYLALVSGLFCLAGQKGKPASTTNQTVESANTALPPDPPLDRFAEDILAFGREDKDHPPPEGGTVFVGSSTFTHAASMLKEYFADFRPIVRAFGGSTIPEINHYLEQTVLKYKPAKIVFYAGTNDLAEGHSGERVFEDFRCFTARVHARLPHTEIIFVSMSMAPSRVQFQKEYEIGNSLIQSLATRPQTLALRRRHTCDVRRARKLARRLVPRGSAAHEPPGLRSLAPDHSKRPQRGNRMNAAKTHSIERHHNMLIPETPTNESMRWILVLLKGIRAEGSYEEHQLRTMRHILACHLDLDGLPYFPQSPSRINRASMTHERMLSLLSDGLFDIVTDDTEGESNRLQAMRIIDMQLGKQSPNQWPDPKFA